MSIRLIEDDKYFRRDVIDNEEFYEFLDLAVDLLIKNKIKSIDYGGSWQYLHYKGNIRAYMAKRVKCNDKQLIFKGSDFELECTLHPWEEITFKDKEIDVDVGGVGLYFTFEKSIRKEYERVKQKIMGSK